MKNTIFILILWESYEGDFKKQFRKFNVIKVLKQDIIITVGNVVFSRVLFHSIF